MLSLDGGGSKGVYTLGVLSEVEAFVGKPLGEHYDLIYGTSTGAIIGAMLALGLSVAEVKKHYFRLIPIVMKPWLAARRSERLRAQAIDLFGKRTFNDFITKVGIVAANYQLEKPLIFKNTVDQAFGRKSTFAPGFGCTIAEALLASTAAYPFFERVVVTTQNQGTQELMDGGFVANNPTLFAIVECTGALSIHPSEIRILSVGVGHYKEPQKNLYSRMVYKLPVVKLLQKQFVTSSNTVELLRFLFFSDITCVRIDESYADAQYETDLLETDVKKLDKIFVLGRESFGKHETEIRQKLFS